MTQWHWIDKAGKQVYSDQAPPADTPEKNILRRSGAQPGRSVFSGDVPIVSGPDAAAAASGAAPARSSASEPRPSGVDSDLARKVRKAEEADKAAHTAELQKVTQARADNCTRARQGRATLDSGMRMGSINAKGEREVMDDNARAIEQARLQSMIDSDCR